MTKFVVDASVVVKWYLPEQYAEEASRLRSRGITRIAPAHIRSEVTNAILKNVRRGVLTIHEARTIVSSVPAMPVTVLTDRGLLSPSFELAARYDRSIYDALYIALAVQEDCQLVTADRRLYNSMVAALPRHLLWIEDLAADDPVEP